MFQALHTGTGVITSWYVDMQNTAAGAVRFDEFRSEGRGDPDARTRFLRG